MRVADSKNWESSKKCVFEGSTTLNPSANGAIVYSAGKNSAYTKTYQGPVGTGIVWGVWCFYENDRITLQHYKSVEKKIGK